MEEGANVMIMIGCDFHPGLQEIVLFDTETGRRREHWLSHAFGPGQVRDFYSGLAQPVLVGLEASGYSQWFEEMLEELGVVRDVNPSLTQNPSNPFNTQRQISPAKCS